MTLKELENYKKMLEESSVQQVQLKEQSLQTDIALKGNLRKVCDAFDKADSELVKTNQEVEDYKERLKESSVQQLQLKDRALQTENALKEELRVVIDAFDKVKSDLAEKIQEAKTCNEMLQESSVQQLRLEEQILQTENALKQNVSDVSNALGKLDSELAQKNQELENYKEVESLTVTELKNYKQKLEESSLQHNRFKEQALQTEYSLKVDLKIVSDALNNVNSELAERIQELEKYKEMLGDSSLQQLRLKEQAVQTENALKEDLRIVSDTLNKVKSELAEKIHELENYEEMLEESSVMQLLLKEQALETENVLKEDLRIVCDALDKVGFELAEKIQEENEIEFELDRWKSAAEHLQCCLDENQVFRREMENSLLAQVETEQTLKQEKEHLIHLVEEKDNRVVAEFQEKQICINALDEVCEKVLKTQVLHEFECQLRNLVIVELEEELTSLQKKVELQEKSLSCTKHQVDQLLGTLKAKQLEMDELGNKLKISEDSAKTLLSEKRTLIQDVAKLTSERENLLSVVEEFSKLVSGFYDKDTELAGRLGRIVDSFDTGKELLMGLKENIECNDSNTENENSAISFSAKNFEVIPDRRSPLIERN
ncbi:Basic helix-loop-helix DNA-binding superfamily protein, putative isoform [Thalictrum thalictroides]|uniref:Basic helix-loop-helix DNA-binding superfamily protein, putative isoform n=1 Tax=Thalictrum thalictroides TaxID=46969 RepID=A0A7J6XD77_THATH|nr:Basic helix-loop-helix DNA-binding superfamily protein, putative isoform [Thalictrum thalictroides]